MSKTKTLEKIKQLNKIYDQLEDIYCDFNDKDMAILEMAMDAVFTVLYDLEEPFKEASRKKLNRQLGKK